MLGVFYFDNACIRYWDCATSIFIDPFFGRIHKKLPGPYGEQFPLSWLLVGLFRLRGELQWWTTNVSIQRFTKKMLHCWAQHVEVGVEKSMRSTCPDPTVESRNHPFTLASRRKGSKALQMALVQRFTCKGGGFVTTKGELSLASLGLVQTGSNLGSRTSSEYVARGLLTTCEFCTDYISSARLKVINFAMDAASIGGEHVPHH